MTPRFKNSKSSSALPIRYLSGILTTVSACVAEGNTSIAANEEDLIAKSVFSSVVTIAFGTTVTITNPLAAKGATITQLMRGLVERNSV